MGPGFWIHDTLLLKCKRYACQGLPDYGSRLVTRSTHDASKMDAVYHLLTSRAGEKYQLWGAVWLLWGFDTGGSVSVLRVSERAA